jgi:hypothetical protein
MIWHYEGFNDLPWKSEGQFGFATFVCLIADCFAHTGFVQVVVPIS